MLIIKIVVMILLHLMEMNLKRNILKTLMGLYKIMKELKIL